MSENSKIEWTNHTFNAWWGCEKVSAGCKFCYAESLDNRYHNANPHWGPGSTRKPMSENYWKQPIKWNAAAMKAGVKAKVFCSSMADVFEGHPDTLEHLNRLLLLIIDTPYLTWQLLTKRPENIMRLIPEVWRTDFPHNVWIGTSVENQEAAELRIPHLLKVPAKVRFLSCEPLLGPLDLRMFKGNGCWFPVLHQLERCNNIPKNQYIHWVIAGGESGPHARPMNIEWVRSLRDQCQTAEVAFFFKQWGEYIYNELESPHTSGFVRIGKKAAGRYLDGRTWDEFPLLSTTGRPDNF